MQPTTNPTLLQLDVDDQLTIEKIQLPAHHSCTFTEGSKSIRIALFNKKSQLQKLTTKLALGQLLFVIMIHNDDDDDEDDKIIKEGYEEIAYQC